MANYTTLDDLDIQALCGAYGLGEAQVQAIKGGTANSSFRLRTAEDDFVLTVLDNHDQDSAVRLARHTRTLFAQGMPTAEVVVDKDGRPVTTMGARPVLLKRWIEGRVAEPLPEDLLPGAGVLLARLHSFAPALMDVPVRTRRLSVEQEARIPEFDDTAFAAWLMEQLASIKKHEAQRQRPAVLCHGDLFADNLICRADGSLAIIDWETVSLDDPLLDLGMAVVGLAQKNGRLSSSRLNLLVDGYTSVRPLAQDDRAELVTETVHAAVIIAFHRYYRHNVRFPNPEMSHAHLRMVDFVASMSSLM